MIIFNLLFQYADENKDAIKDIFEKLTLFPINMSSKNHLYFPEQSHL